MLRHNQLFRRVRSHLPSSAFESKKKKIAIRNSEMELHYIILLGPVLEIFTSEIFLNVDSNTGIPTQPLKR